ncbi:MAG: glutathione S-transferase [Gammaproteobacteria bacterium]|jgi:glutathione S-transferase
MLKIYGDIFSGNCYKIKLLCVLLEIDHEWIPIDILKSETRTDEFLQINPGGAIPVLTDESGQVYTESNAILYFLGQNSEYWPEAVESQTRVLQWMFFEQYSHEPNIAVARFIEHYLGLPDERKDEYLSKQKGGIRALKIMELRLLVSKYLVGETPSLADISLFAYTHVAHEGGFDLSQFPAVQQWIENIKALLNFTGMEN